MSGVAFQQIPANFIPPLFYVEFNNQLAGVVGQTSQPALMIGQTITPQSEVPVFIPTAAYARSLFGAGSMLARMCATYLAADPIGPLYALPLADAPGSTAASDGYNVTGTALVSGTLNFTIAGQLVTVGVSVGDTATIIAGNIAAACNALQTLPVSAVASAGDITFTALNKGAAGNNISIWLNLLGAQAGQVLPAGITLPAYAQLTGGATDPDLGGVAAILGDQLYDFIAHPYSEATQLGEISAMLADNGGRWAWNRQSYGHAFTAIAASSANALTAGGNINDQHTTMVQYFGPAAIWDVAADVAGTVAVSLRNIASQPLQTLKLNTTIAAQMAYWNNLATEQALLSAGVSVLRYDQYGNATIGQLVTTYKTNQYGQPDASYRYVTTLFTLMAITRQIKAALVTKFGRSILVPNGTRGNPNVPFVTPNDIRAEIAAQYDVMEQNGLVVNAQAMITATSVTINANNPARVDIVWRPELANGLDMIAMINQFVLNPAAAA